MSVRFLSSAEGRNADSYAPLDWALLATSATIFGSSFLFMAEALEAFAPSVVTFLRILFGFATLSAFPSSRDPIDRADWPRIALVGVVWFAAPLSFFPLAQQYIDSSLAGMLNGATPLATAFIAAALLGRLPGVRQRFGIALGFAGIVLIAVPSLEAGAGAGAGTGIALSLAAVMCYGVAFNITVPLQHRYGSLPILWRALLVAVALTAPLGLVGFRHSTFQVTALGACILVGVFGTGIAFVTTATLTGRVGSTRSSVLTYVATPISIALGVFLRHEPFAWVTGIGTTTALVGAFLATRADPRQ